MIIKMIVEQEKNSEYRNKYNQTENTFIKTEYKFLLTDRGLIGVYGWIEGYGKPPEKHLDIIHITEKDYQLGQVINSKIVGCFKRNDSDHKVIGIEVNRDEKDLFELKDREIKMLKQLYPEIREGEGWIGKEETIEMLGIRS